MQAIDDVLDCQNDEEATVQESNGNDDQYLQQQQEEDDLGEYIQLASDHKEVGNQFFHEGNLQRAASEYVECINTLDALVRITSLSEAPVRIETLQLILDLKVTAKANLALVLLKQGDLNRALEHVTDAIALNEEYNRGLFIRSKIYLLLGNYVRARNDVNAILKTTSENEEAKVLKMNIEAMMMLGS
jgi:tetratricopeptide (TPR) repeat protein